MNEPLDLPHGELPLGAYNPLRSLNFAKTKQELRKARYINVAELVTLDPPAREKLSDHFHLRNCALFGVIGGCGLRAKEARERDWDDTFVYALEGLGAEPIARLEEALVGAVEIDDENAAIVLEIKDPKNAIERLVPVVAEYREALVAHARAYIWGRHEQATSQRDQSRRYVRSRRRDADTLLASRFRLRFPLATVSLEALEDHGLWRSAVELTGDAELIHETGRREILDASLADALLRYLRSLADAKRYLRVKEMIRAHERGKPVSAADLSWLRAQPVLVGPMFPSRRHGAIGEDQLNYIFDIYGLRADGVLPRTLRSNWSRFSKAATMAALEKAAANHGHRDTKVTHRNYDGPDIAVLVQAAREVADIIRTLRRTQAA